MQHLKSTTHQALLGEVGCWTSEEEHHHSAIFIVSFWVQCRKSSREPRTPSLTAPRVGVGERERVVATRRPQQQMTMAEMLLVWLRTNLLVKG